MKTKRDFIVDDRIVPNSVENMSADFLTYIIRLRFGEKAKRINEFSISPVKPGLISEIKGQISRIELNTPSALPASIILKANPIDEIVHQELINKIILQNKHSLAALIPNLKFNIREALTYKNLSIKYAEFMPYPYYIFIDKLGGRIWLFLEDLKEFDLYNKWWDLDSWKDYHLDLVLRDLARFHSQSWNDIYWRKKRWLLNSNPPRWQSFIKQSFLANLSDHPSYFDATRTKILQDAVKKVDLIWNKLSFQPHTLIHGDCTPRNICFRSVPSGLTLTLYDWALTAYHPPQFDLAKFLLFLYDPYKDIKIIRDLVDKYFYYLPKCIQSNINKDDFYSGFELACIHYVLVYLTVISRYDETENLKWLFREFEYRLRFLELIKMP
jgi:hypothetical protein